MVRINLLFLPVPICIHNSSKPIEVKYCIKYSTNTKTSASLESRMMRVFLDWVESSMCGIILRSASSMRLFKFSLLFVIQSLYWIHWTPLHVSLSPTIPLAVKHLLFSEAFLIKKDRDINCRFPLFLSQAQNFSIWLGMYELHSILQTKIPFVKARLCRPLNFIDCSIWLS